MALGPRLDLRQSQSLVMTPQLQQAIRLLALSNLELEAVVAEEIEKNPLLCADSDDGEPVQPAPDPRPEGTPSDEVMDRGEAEAALDGDYAGEVFHHDGFGDAAAPTGSGEDIDFDSFAAAAASLHDHLNDQAGARLSGTDLAIALVLIDAIDEAGYLSEPLEAIADRLGVARARAEAVLAVIHGFDPTGVGARSLSECLTLQAKEADRYDPCMALLLDHLDMLARGQIAPLQRLCGVDAEDMAEMIRELRGYDPKPGLRFGGGRVDSVVPDVLVSPGAKGGWRVDINPVTLPRVLVDRGYHAELSAVSDRKGKAWLNECLANAHWLTRALDQRQRTIVKVTAAIVAAQEGFFRHGVSQLRPLTLRQIADQVELHESTVSRVTSNKYLACPRGTFELKYFFSSAIQAADGGEAASALAVKSAIARLIAGEGEDILSDDTLVDRLRQEGFDIARRTVAKYREALGLGSSVQRRRARAIGR